MARLPRFPAARPGMSSDGWPCVPVAYRGGANAKSERNGVIRSFAALCYSIRGQSLHCAEQA